MTSGQRTLAGFAAAVAVIVIATAAAVRIADGSADGSAHAASPVVTAETTPAAIDVIPSPIVTSEGPIVAVPDRQPTAVVDLAFVELDGGARAIPAGLRGFEAMEGSQLSPDGRWIAFTYRGQLYLASVDGDRVAPVTSPGGATSPAWSPDGRRLVYKDGDGVRIVDIASRRVTSLVRSDVPIMRPTFGPGGRTILFTAPKETGLWLWEAPVAGGPATPLFRGAFGAYSPDGALIAFRATGYDGDDVTEMTSSTLLIADRSGHVVERVVGGGGAWMSQVDPTALWPVWSPDGSLVAYQWLYGHSVRVVDAATGTVVDNLPVEFGTNARPSWLDDDTLILALGSENP